jgi:molybdopterin converting factor subunit 1
MRVRIRYFAAVREILGRAEETLELRAGARVGDVLEAVLQRDPRLEPLRGVLRVARNLALAPADAPLEDGDEIALIPPVMGGAGAPRPPVSATPIELTEAAELVRHDGAGAVVTFLGTVRDEHDGHPVAELEYEAYVEMAERVLRDVVASIEARWPGVRLAVLHRIGVLGVGETAVAIAAAAPHRAEAFEACREAIERLKREVPVWKKEHGPDGAVWLGLGS